MQKKLITFILLTHAVATFAISRPILLISNEDGTQWQQKSVEFNGQLNSITQFNDILLAAGQETQSFYRGVLYKSNDSGQTWLPVINPADSSAYSLDSINATNQAIISIGSNPVYFRSNNGDIWNTINIKTNGVLATTNNNGKDFIAVGSSGKALMMKSIDNGLTWSSADINLPTELISSSGGLNWVTWDDKQWIAVGDRYTNNYRGIVITSADGKNWSLSSEISSLKNIQRIAANASQWLVIGSLQSSDINAADAVAMSNDQGKSWLIISTLPAGMHFYQIRWNGHMWVLVGSAYTWPFNYPVLYTSLDGITWTQQALPDSIMHKTGISYISDIIWDKTHWVAVGMYDDSTQDICDNLTNTHWAGFLNSNDIFQPGSVNVNDLNIASVASGTVWSAMLVYNNNTNVGFNGSCTKNADGSATVNLVNSPYAMTFVISNKEANSIEVTQSNLLSSGKFKNVVGTLTKFKSLK